MAKKSSKKSLFGAYDIRGTAGDGLDQKFARHLGSAIGQYLSPQRAAVFVIGYDVRSSSPSLATALAQGLISQGHSVVDLGLASTPRIYWHGAQKHCDGSIAITASHLPPQFNGFKICRAGSVPLSAEEGLPQIAQLVDCPRSQFSGSIGKLVPAPENSLASYIDALSAFMVLDKEVKIAVDAGGSAAGIELEKLLGRFAKVKLASVGMAPDGTFAQRSPNPFDEGAADALKTLVIQSQAQLGAAFDGDADRLLVIDEKGQLVPPDLVLALLSKQLLERQPGAKILYDLRSSRSVPEYIESLGGIAVKTRIGHSLIKSDMRKQSAALAGELSGHYYFADLFFTDNALRSLICLINLISSSSLPLSELVRPLSRYAVSGELNFGGVLVEGILAHLASTFKDGNQSRIDGLSVDYDTWWFNVRSSKTESLLRLCVGATTQELLQKQTKLMTQTINQFSQQDANSRQLD